MAEEIKDYNQAIVHGSSPICFMKLVLANNECNSQLFEQCHHNLAQNFFLS